VLGSPFLPPSPYTLLSLKRALEAVYRELPKPAMAPPLIQAAVGTVPAISFFFFFYFRRISFQPSVSNLTA